jgi:hypothetical protein
VLVVVDVAAAVVCVLAAFLGCQRFFGFFCCVKSPSKYLRYVKRIPKKYGFSSFHQWQAEATSNAKIHQFNRTQKEKM